MQGADPVRVGLVGSLNRPGGNLTGIDLFLTEVVGNRLQQLLELLPAAKSIAYLRNPTNPVFAETETREVQACGGTVLGFAYCSRTQVAQASSNSAFAQHCSAAG